MDMYNAPKMNQIAMLQQQAKLEQMRGLDPVSQQNIAASQASVRQGDERLDLARGQEQRVSKAEEEKRMQQKALIFSGVADYLKQFDMDQRIDMIPLLNEMTGQNITPDKLTDKTLEDVSTMGKAIRESMAIGPGANNSKPWDFKVVGGSLFKTNKNTGEYQQISVSNPINKPENMPEEVFDVLKHLNPEDQAKVMTDYLKPSTVEKQKKITSSMIKAKKKSIDDARLAIDAADKALENLGFWSTGLPGRIGSMFAGSDRKDLEGALSSLKSVITQESLQAMREASPTGGALGNVTEKELPIIQDKLGSLDADQGREVLEENILDIKRRFEIVKAIALGQVSEPITEEDYNAIPPGNMFLDPESGELLRKP